MFWADKLLKNLDKDADHLINDSKTPSGRAHVGALRGVLIHHAMYRVMKDAGLKVKYQFGVDDYDPLDELPYGKDEHFRQYLGQPLCNVPAPEGSNATDMADFYITDFFSVFKDLGVEVDTYHTKDIYRAGGFDESIDIILNHADLIRHIYKQVSGSDRSANWYPFQTVCENCGKIGTTEVTDYDGKEVTYTCHKNMVTWAEGCGHTGKMSPFSGNGKLPWKLEWVAKWATMGITVEGAGKDHTTKGGSRDVAAACLRKIFNKKVPLNIPYEFFLVEGAKMSSSKGIGVSAREMADFLPPEILRFMMLKSQPNRPINFSPDEQSIIKLFNEYDQTRNKVFNSKKVNPDLKRVYAMSEVEAEGDYFSPSLQLLQALVQLPHIDVVAELTKRKHGELTERDLNHLKQRIQSVQYWLDNYATEAEKITLQAEMPEKVAELNTIQRAFLKQLSVALADVEWTADTIQTAIFTVTRGVPIAQPLAFKAIYTALFARDSGPRAGNLFEFLDRDFIIARFAQMTYDENALYLDSIESVETFHQFLSKKAKNIETLRLEAKYIQGHAIADFHVQLTDGKVHLHRLGTECAQADMMAWLETQQQQAGDLLS